MRLDDEATVEAQALAPQPSRLLLLAATGKALGAST